MTHITKCLSCHQLIDTEDFWDVHQTMQDGNIWCVRKTAEIRAKAIVDKAKDEVKSKYGNRKRHRQ